MSLNRKLFCLMAFLACCGRASAATLETRYYDVDLRPGVDMYAMIERLRDVPVIRYELLHEASETAQDIFAGMLDAVYLHACETLDIHMTSFRIGLVVLPDAPAVGRAVVPFLGVPRQTPSFYHRDTNTIYISAADLRCGILAHETGHAVINHYFIVPPPEKMQEVLCGYVEYSLMRDSVKQ
jgi:hypothetical protein